MPSRIYTALLFLIFCFPLSASELYDQVEIISSDDQGIHFIMNIDNPEELFYRLSDKDSLYYLGKQIVIGFPPNTAPVIVSAKGSKPRDLIDIGRKVIPYGTSFAVLEGTNSLRGHRTASIMVYPFTSTTAYSRIEVEIKFIGNGNSIPLGETENMGKIYDPIYRYTILNYDRLRIWPAEKRAGTKKAAASEFTRSAEWYRIKTGREGVAVVTGADLIESGADLENLSVDSIRMFYGGGMPLPPENNKPEPAFREISIAIRDNGDGLFGASDSILYFAEGADRWRYPSDSTPLFLENHYTNTNTYWLTYTGNFADPAMRISTVNGTPAVNPDTVIIEGHFQARANQNNEFYVDNNLRIFDYYNWYWTSDSRFLVRLWLPEAISGDTADISIRAKTGFNIGLQVNNQSESRLSFSRNIYTFKSDHLAPGWNNFYVLLDESTSLPTYLDYLEVSYKGLLQPEKNITDFWIDDYTGQANFIINTEGNYDESPVIYDLEDPDHPLEIGGAVNGTEELNFGRTMNGVGPHRFYLASPTAFISPDSIIRSNVSDIRGNLAQTDMFILAPVNFMSTLDSYEEYRETESNITISRVSLEQILYNFSYGMYDPVAVRDFLKYAYENAPAPAPGAVLLVGDGTFDFENNLGTATINHFPPYIHPLDSSSSDDNYVYFGEYGLLDSDTTYPGDRGYDMMVSRWPVKNNSEIQTIVDKIESYESSTSFGPWRSTITLVADDEFGAFETEWFHTSQTEELQQPPRIPAAFRRNKIYLWDYPFDSNREKPEVNEAIVKSFNDGTLLINYVGHGNPDTWAHEHVFNRNTDLPLLHNNEKLPLVSTFSCSIGFFDDPTREGMAEDLLRFSGGGAISVVSATRLVYSSDNSELNKQFFAVLFGSDSLSICQALYISKILRQYQGGDPQTIRNDRNYTHFGDPFVRLRVPQYGLSITEKPDSLIALGKHHVAGEVIDKDLGTPVDFSGTLQIYVYDSEKEKKYEVVNQFGDSIKTVEYALEGPVIYRGNAEISGGRFDFSFIAPLDIGYGGNSAKIIGYAVSENTDALGLADSIAVGSEISSVADIDGPEIKFTFGDNGTFISGDKIASGETLNLTIVDSSGINLTGSLGHGITLVVDDIVENTVNLTYRFHYLEGSYTTGSIAYEIGEMEPGLHSFKVKAWDNANNSSVVEFDADITESGQLMVYDLMNYPNPMAERTTFSFSLTSPANLVRLELFTLSGKKIKEYHEDLVPSGYVEFYAWDGRDADMDRVATGVYIYKLTAVSEDNSETVESFGKIVVLN